MNHTFDNSQDLGQLLGSGLSPHSPFCLSSEKAIGHWGQHWNDKNQEHCSGEMEAICVSFGRLTISKQCPAPKCPYKGALYWGAGLGVGSIALLGGIVTFQGTGPVRSGISLLWIVL